MAAVLIVDTHVLVWMYLGGRGRIPRRVQRRLEREALALSPFTELELTYLHDIGRLRPAAAEVLHELTARLGIITADVSAAAVCRAALDLTWTRDPFDRLLCGHAIASQLPLVTRDETIRQHLPLAWWAE